MDYKKVEELINDWLTNEWFDEIYSIAKKYEDIQNEAKAYDADGDLITLEAKNEDVIEYIRRSSATDNDWVDDGVYAKRIKRFDWIISVEDIYQ